MSVLSASVGAVPSSSGVLFMDQLVQPSIQSASSTNAPMPEAVTAPVGPEGAVHCSGVNGGSTGVVPPLPPPLPVSPPIAPMPPWPPVSPLPPVLPPEPSVFSPPEPSLLPPEPSLLPPPLPPAPPRSSSSPGPLLQAANAVGIATASTARLILERMRIWICPPWMRGPCAPHVKGQWALRND